MISVLQVVTPGITTFLDPGPDVYLSTIVTTGGLGAPVTCAVFPVTPANQVVVAGTLPQLLINNNPQPFSSPPVAGNPMMLSFTVGNKPAIEVANSWNSINITVQDNTGTQTAFSTIWYFVVAGLPPLPPPPAPPPPPLPPPPPPPMHPKPRKKAKR